MASMAKEEVAIQTHSRERTSLSDRDASRRVTPSYWVLDAAGTIACTAPAYAYVDNLCRSFASFALYRGEHFSSLDLGCL